ncbi:Ribonuclease P protein subunit P38-like protein [Perilla frutescens var. hirtella]|nr:Ribonuclease P protein subunit P38-like protein [Perilla frutescens var. frutescens]KAH6784753.1 Ribonuclease P protein subunit P38-like protein [Perilla frutescens var. hirtella]KAH6803393.1 Ribonuclease P protein subunit P38-like protein [Perilla frutescens var. frutescens]
MAAQEQQEEYHENQEQQKLHFDEHFGELLSTYLGLSFTIFLGLLPKNSIPLISTFQSQNKVLSFKLMQAEEQLKQLHSRRKEDSKANARVVEIFASHRHAWQQEEKRLLQQIDDCNEEIAFLKSKVEDFEGVEAEMKAGIEDLKREVGEREEMLSFMSRSNCDSGGECYGDMGLRYGKAEVSEGVEECFNGGRVDEMGSVYGQSNGGFSSDFLNSAASKFWPEKASLWQDMQQYEPVESVYHVKHFVSRRESPWKVDGDSTGVSSKLKLLEQELLNLERVCKADLSKVPSQMRKQAKRYQALAGKIDDLCRRMQASDPCEASLSSEFRMQRQTEFLLEAFRLQQRASETTQKLTALQTETGKSYNGGGGEVEGPAKLATRRSLDSIRNNFKEIQRNLEIWLARIIGDLEGLLSRDGASRAREYYVSRYPFVQ